MTAFLAALAVAFGVVFLAELGDKTQLLALNFGAQYPLRRVALGLALGYGSAGIVAVGVGTLLGTSLPERPIQIVGGIVFIVFGLLALRPDDGDGDDTGGGDIGDGDPGIGHDLVGDPERRAGTTASIARTSAVASIGLAILVAEMGDKTQIATATLATQANPVATWIGATAGAVASGMIGAVAGTLIGDRIPTTVLRIASGVLFIAFGVAMLLSWP